MNKKYKNNKKENNKMKKIAIIDLECTCDNQTPPLMPRDKMEIIEIGCVIADLEGNTYKEFNAFVKPVFYPTLTPFCKELTTITQSQVDNGFSLEKAMTDLDDFLFNENVDAWGSWGGFDKNQIIKDLKNHKIRESLFPFLNMKHFNISEAYYKNQGMSRKCGVRKALSQQKMTFVGTPHRGIDDVKNIARLLPYTNISL